MKKRIALFLVLIGGVFCVLSLSAKAAPQTATVNLTTSIQEYIALSVTSGSPVPFGNLTPGTPIAAPEGGTVTSVTTNAANGYTIGLSDGIASSNSSMVHTDTTTYIPDYAGTIATPTSWTGTGVGITLVAAASKNTTTWGSGAAYDAAGNKYAGIPQAATTAYTSTGFKSVADTSTWAFKLDVPNTQKTGDYAGLVTFTATAVLL